MSVNIPSLDELLEAGVHFGHVTSRWHPKMEPFLYGKKGDIHLIDLSQTHKQLEKAAKIAQDLASKGKKILFVGVKPLARNIIEEEAKRCDSPYVVHRWIGGTLTNWSVISGMLKRMSQIEQDKQSGRLAKYTKKEQLIFGEEYEKLEHDIGGIRKLAKAPEAMFLVDAKYDKTALAEARKLKIPVISIVDTNINPKKITHPIPGNDDSLKSMALITRVIADAIIAGQGLDKSKE